MKMTSARVISALCILTAAAAAGAGGRAEPAEKAPILRIGTVNETKAANIFTDYYLGIFAHLSNPPLMQMLPDGSLAGLTAESWSVSEDGTVWRFTVRDDLYWSDGRKVTAEDARFSIEYTGRNSASSRWIADTLKESRIENGRTVVFTFSKPYATLALEFATYVLLPKHVWESVTDPGKFANAGATIGCGPFVIQAVDIPAGVIRFARNPYWKGRAPKIRGLEVQSFKNMDVLAMALERGDVDTFYGYAATYPYAGIDRLNSTDRFSFVKEENLGLVFLGFNLKKAPLSDRAFRVAISYALDYAEIARIDVLGYGRTASRGFVPPGTGGFVETPKLIHDPDRARELLAATGYRDADGDGAVEGPDGRAIKLSLVVRSDWTRLGELIKDYLGRIGVQADLRSLDLQSWAAEKDAYRYDLTVTRTTPWGMLMHAGWGSGYFDSRRTGQGVLHVLDDPAFLALADKALSLADPVKRAAVGAEIQEYYSANLPGIALCWSWIVTPFNKSLAGWKPDPLYGIYNIETMISMERTSD